MLRNIVLIGFMGCGKSSVGRRLAGMTGHRFLDTDELIVEKRGQPISEIFAINGEAAFRDLESAELESLCGVGGIILATGGGIVLREENQARLREIGTVVWLDARPDLLFERVSRNQKRPLLQTENPRQTFDRLLNARRSIYGATADFRVDSTGLTHDETAQLILEECRRFEGCRIRG
ncbi:MAG TPA: shikimate kinase [Chthoniobacterales bacterium]